MDNSGGPERVSWEMYEARARAARAAWIAVEDGVQTELRRRVIAVALEGKTHDFDPVRIGQHAFVDRHEFDEARASAIVNQAMIEARLEDHEQRIEVLERLKAWLDPLRMQIEALFDIARRWPGRSRRERHNLTRRMRTEIAAGVVTQAGIAVTQEELLKTPGRFEEHYTHDRRTIRRAAGDL